ncbi:hypothetical protein [Roseovarius salinarum]|uniref:hypothetical protein n=1 Tax=Roseovarius salinarum TaxID=1981892 RepID=UPI000C33B71F|nr:hypothetical protein [Roseovarius salinarum]
MTETDMDSTALKAHFEAARQHAPSPPDALMARVMADALAEQAAAPDVAAPARGRWAELLRALGGWPAVAGLACATLAGVWIGAFPPVGLQTAAGGLLTPDAALYTVDVMPATAFDASEGPS